MLLVQQTDNFFFKFVGVTLTFLEFFPFQMKKIAEFFRINSLSCLYFITMPLPNV